MPNSDFDLQQGAGGKRREARIGELLKIRPTKHQDAYDRALKDLGSVHLHDL
jgi:hypothetical protein